MNIGKLYNAFNPAKSRTTSAHEVRRTQSASTKETQPQGRKKTSMKSPQELSRLRNLMAGATVAAGTVAILSGLSSLSVIGPVAVLVGGGLYIANTFAKN